MKTTKKNIVTVLLAMFVMAVTMFGTAIVSSALTYDEAVETARTTTITEQILPGSIEKKIESISGDLKKIGMAIAGVAVIALGIVLVGGGGQGLQKAKPMAISICVGIIVLSLGTTLVAAIAGT